MEAKGVLDIKNAQKRVTISDFAGTLFPAAIAALQKQMFMLEKQNNDILEMLNKK